MTLTHCGTRPGDGLADLFFGFAFSAYFPDPREDPKSRSLKGVPIKYPLVVRVPN